MSSAIDPLKVSDEETLSEIAEQEQIAIDRLQAGISSGEIVVFGDVHGPVRPLAIGAGLSTKVNANLGTSPDFPDLDQELSKLQAAVTMGADTVMDLSTGGDLDEIRRAIREHCPVTLGTVPIYQAAVEASDRLGHITEMTADQIFEVIERQAQDGVDFMTLHCAVTRATVAELDKAPRVGGIVSRGGSMLARWMQVNDAENPLYDQFDRLLDILDNYGVAASLGDGLRPGAIADASDLGQIAEMRVQGELVKAARERGVQVFVEGPGHMPLDQIAGIVALHKQLAYDAPLYVLGPLVTDIAPGYDHITAAIGGTLCAAAGADYLCYVTPAEHIGLPDEEDVVRGVLTTRLAAHAADLVKGVPGAAQWDAEMSDARFHLDWSKMAKLALDPGTVYKRRGERATLDPKACSMCSKFCSIKLELARQAAATGDE